MGSAAAGQSAGVIRTTTAPVVATSDFDGDAINDVADACPSVPRGPADKNGDGCPDGPETSVTGGPADNSFATSTAAAFGLASDEAGSTFTCSLDDGAGGACTSPRRLSGLAATTHTLSVWARDAGGDPDPTAATRTWTVPRDDAVLKHSTGWKQVRASGYFLNTYSTSARKGAALTSKVVGARSLALVATTGPGFGKVKVLLGSVTLRTINLAATRLRKRQVLPVTTFSTPTTGTLKLVVATSGKPVRIEGLGVASR